MILSFLVYFFKLDSLAEDVDVRGIEEVGADVGSTTSDEVMATNGKNLAHGVSTMENARLV